MLIFEGGIESSDIIQRYIRYSFNSYVTTELATSSHKLALSVILRLKYNDYNNIHTVPFLIEFGR